MATVNATKVYITSNTYKGNTNIVNVNLNNVQFTNNNAEFAFNECTNLTHCSNLSTDTTNIGGMFYNCSSLTNAPTIPASVTSTCVIDNMKTYYGYDLSEPIFSEQYYTTVYSIYILTETLEPYGEVYFDDYGSLSPFGSYYYDEGMDELIIDQYGDTYHTHVTRNSSLDRQEEIPVYLQNFYGAFTGCSNLVNAPVLTEGITNIDYLFFDTPNLSSVNIPHSVQSMCNTFHNCTGLREITLNTNATNLANTFYGCSNLTDVNVIGNEENLSYTFTLCPNLVNVTLGENVTTLYETFAGCTSLKTINIPNSVTNLAFTFSGCKALTDTPTIPDSVTSLWGTFSGCSNLVNANNLGNNVTSLSSTFSSCTNLASVTFPAAVTSVYRTFSGCTGLVEVRGSFANLTGSMDNMFENCRSLTTVPDIPSTVTSMFNTFNGCSSLVEVPNIPQGINLGATFSGTGVNNVNKVFLTNPSSIWDTFSSCPNLVSVEMDVPSSVTTMSSAFAWSTNLVYFNGQIPTSVTGMQWAFQGCSKLKNLPTVPSSVTSIFNAFKWCNSWNGSIYIDSTNISNAANAFFLTSVNATVNTRKVYIYFKYTNGQNTKTYNALTKAGYSASTRKHGVLLQNRGSHD